jgi:flagellar biosynthesis protein FliP
MIRGCALAGLALLCLNAGLRAEDRTTGGTDRRPVAPVARVEARPNQAAQLDAVDGSQPIGLGGLDPRAAARSLQAVALFGLVSLAPVALLMLTGFIRISIALTLLRQAIGSPQVPGNQVITALSLMLTALVMWPCGERVYREAVAPYAAGKITLAAAWDAGSGPIKAYMLRQLEVTHHQSYLESLYEHATPSSPGNAEPAPQRPEDYPFRVIAPAYLLSEVTTGILIGFYIYLPFLVVDLVVSAVLAATGLFMLPPAMVAIPIKLILFVLADGGILVPTMLMRSFGPPGG